MTAKTPVYGIEYIIQGEPVRNTRLALENNAKTVEAALVRGGIAPPAAQDLATLSGRVTVLEGKPLAQVHQTAAQALGTGWTAVTFGAADFDLRPGSTAQYSATATDRLTCRQNGVYRVAGIVASGTSSAAYVLAAHLRKNGTALPASQTRGAVNVGAAGGLPTSSLVQLAAGDYVQLMATAAAGVSTFVAADFTSQLTLECVRVLP